MEELITQDTLPVYIDAFLGEIKKRDIHLVLLEGDLGAGKTTYTQTLAKILGITEPVLSPTFVLMKTYTTTDSLFKKLTHIDAYRIEDNTLFETLRLKESLLDTSTLFCVEWPDRIQELGMYPHAKVQLSYGVNPDERYIKVTYHE